MTSSTALILLLLAAPARAASGLSALQDSFAEVAAGAKPSVVNITTVHRETEEEGAQEFYFGNPEDLFNDFFQNHPRHPRVQPYRFSLRGTGSGAIIDPRGYVATNDHVVRGADEIKITLTTPDGKTRTVPGRVVGRDPGMDLAVVKIEGKGPYPALKLGDSSKMKVGYWALAIGSPFELEQTVTVGVLSAIRQSLEIEGHRFRHLLQTDAAINRGNSGGPLLNLDGEIIGINTAIFSPSGASAGIGFAIPINEAKQSLAALMEGKTIRRGWLGVDLGEVDEVMQKRFGLPAAQGALVNSVMEASPAAKAGLKRGDVIFKFDGGEVESPSDLAFKVSRAAPGRDAALEVYRDGKPLELRVTLGERPSWAEEGGRRPPSHERAETAPDPSPFRWEGLSLSPTDDGVSIDEVSGGSKLRDDLREGDLIKAVNQKPVRSLDDFKRLAPSLNLGEGVVFDLRRNGQPVFVTVQTQ